MVRTLASNPQTSKVQVFPTFYKKNEKKLCKANGLKDAYNTIMLPNLHIPELRNGHFGGNTTSGVPEMIPQIHRLDYIKYAFFLDKI